MSEEYEIKYSTLCQKVTSEGKSVQVYIYEDGKGGWILKVFDTIEKEGISSLIGTENDYLH